VIDSWIPVARESDFPIQNVPFGVVVRGGEPRIATAIGENVVDLREVARARLLEGVCDAALLEESSLNALFAARAWRAVRARVIELLREGGDPALRELGADRFLLPMRDAVAAMPVEIGDYVDFYSSLQHATNLGRLFRPNAEPLLPNWRWIPIGYHGRSSTIVIDGTPVRRPHGQRKHPNAEIPKFGASAMLDIELEVGFVTGYGNAHGSPIPVSRAAKHIAGLVLVNDWSARDIQAWEYQPLGPFLGKSFATTISPWIVTLDALEPFRVRGPVQEPAPLAYLADEERTAYDVHLTVELQTPNMREAGMEPAIVTRTNFAQMYWTMEQQLAHATANGASTRPGDLFASGTISGDEPGSYGSFIETTWRGERPIVLPNGESRAFLNDGDEITLRGWCEKPGERRIGFGTARGRVVAPT
jgi:fumarylacetoacetase